MITKRLQTIILQKLLSIYSKLRCEKMKMETLVITDKRQQNYHLDNKVVTKKFSNKANLQIRDFKVN